MDDFKNNWEDRVRRYDEYDRSCKNVAIENLLNLVVNKIIKRGKPLFIKSKNKKAVEELHLFFGKIIHLDIRLWNWMKSLLVDGDLFIELVKDPDCLRDGVMAVQILSPSTMHCLSDGYGQSSDGPNDKEMLRFDNHDIVHMKIANTKYDPYGVSLLDDSIVEPLTLSNNIIFTFKKAMEEGCLRMAKEQLRLKKMMATDLIIALL